MFRGGLDLGHWVSAAVSAVQLLTKLPLPAPAAWNEAVGRRSIVFYPLAGAVIGLALGAVFAWIPVLLPSAPAAAVLLGVWVWLTGGLHLDGWMDTADALGSYRSRERMLEIMKDPRVGAMGVAAGTLLLLGKLTLLYALLEYARMGSVNVGAALACVPIAARAFLPWAIVGWPYAGGAGGMGAALRSAGYRHAFASLVIAAAGVLLVFRAVGTGDAEFVVWIGAAAGLLTAAAGSIGSLWLSRKLGGLTGDSYGALTEGLELLLLLTLAAAGHQASV
jgi:adenosylcobinamide-GDP ribazoletransferase